jgi:cytochrome P450
MTEPARAASAADDQLILDERHLSCPHEFLKLLREERPVIRVTAPPGISAWLVTRHQDARAALADPRLAKSSASIYRLVERHMISKDHVHVAAGEAFGEHMLNSDPPDHTRLRRLVGRAFTARRVAQLRPRIEQITDELLGAMETKAAGTGGEVDLLDTFAFPLTITVICELLGVPPASCDDFRRWSKTLLSTGPAPLRSAASESMYAYIQNLVDDKRCHPGDDVLSTIVEASEDADQLTDREAVSMVFLLLSGGHETTVNLIGNGVVALLRHPDQLAALRNDPSLTPKAVEELLRYDGPVNMASYRYTTEPVVIGGTTIPADEFVFVSVASANRDADHYPDADRLDIHREGAGSLAFGHGIHYCLAAPLARLEGEIAFNALLARFPHLRLARDPDELSWRSSFNFNGLNELLIRITG